MFSALLARPAARLLAGRGGLSATSFAATPLRSAPGLSTATAASRRSGGGGGVGGMGQSQLRRYSSGGSYSRKRQNMPMNTIIKFVPQQQAWVVERFGRFHSVLEPGLRVLIPIVDEIKYVHSLKEIALEIPAQSAITQDNVTLHLDGVLYLLIDDPYKASYGVEDPEYAVKQLAQTTMRSELGKMTLDEIFKERSVLNHSIVDAINSASQTWGIRCLRYEIRDISLPDDVVRAMTMQVAAERSKRATVLESEGEKMSAINVAEGHKQAQILASEAAKNELINHAFGEASAILAKAKATAEGIKVVAEAAQERGGSTAISLTLAQDYVKAFSKLAKSSTTMLLPSQTGDVGAMVAQAMTIMEGVKDQSRRRGVDLGEEAAGAASGGQGAAGAATREAGGGGDDDGDAHKLIRPSHHDEDDAKRYVDRA